MPIWAQIHTDDFNRADSSDLGTNYSSGATGGWSNLRIVSNQVQITATSVPGREFLNGYSLGDLRAQLTLSTLGAGKSWLPRLLRGREVIGGFIGYEITVGDVSNLGSTIRVRRYDPAATDLLNDSSVTWASGDVFLLDIVGSTFTMYRNGTSVVSTTDATYTVGNVGFGITDDTSPSDCIIDDFTVWAPQIYAPIGPLPTFRPDLI